MRHQAPPVTADESRKRVGLPVSAWVSSSNTGEGPILCRNTACWRMPPPPSATPTVLPVRRKGLSMPGLLICSPLLVLLRCAALMMLVEGVLAPSVNTTVGVSQPGVPVAVPLPVTADDLNYESMALVAIVVTIGAAGGIGGGGVLVPVLMISENIGPHGAIPMSKMTIFGSAVCQFALNLRKRHVLDPRRPLIDFDTTLMLEPPTLLGTVYGVTLNRMTPRWIIATLLMLFLAITAFRTFVKGYRLFMAESQLSPRSRGDRIRPDVSAMDESAELESSNAAIEDLSGPPPIPWTTTIKLFVVWCAVFLAALARRTENSECGSFVHTGVLAALTVFIAWFSHGALVAHFLRMCPALSSF